MAMITACYFAVDWEGKYYLGRGPISEGVESGELKVGIPTDFRIVQHVNPDTAVWTPPVMGFPSFPVV
jgi:hypothetical protein